jgi:formylglycine-generating enzyme required for sulfatase activity
MGCSPEDSECYPDEKPEHQVVISRGFWIGQTEVTLEAYQKVTGKDPSHFKGLKRPVEEVTWNDAQGYCRAVGMRLPTEAEWEYAARAGSSAGRYGELDRIAWFAANSGSSTHDVGGKAPNGFGLKDMLGNLWEWVADWDAAYATGDVTDPQGPADGTAKTLRGGSWGYASRFARVSSRSRLGPADLGNYVGFRCAGN